MAGQPAAHPAAPGPCHLLGLPSELILQCLHPLLEKFDVHTSLHLLQVCKTLHNCWQPVVNARRAADASRIQFLHAEHEGGDIGAWVAGKFTSLHRTTFHAGKGDRQQRRINFPWVAAAVLPTSGTYAWRVTLNIAQSVICVGVCSAQRSDDDLCQAWTLSMYDGKLQRSVYKKSKGFTRSGEWNAKEAGSPPPPGYPDGDNTDIFPGLQRMPTEYAPRDQTADLTPNVCCRA